MSKTGRNDPCPCGSGAKYKKCCINKPILKHGSIADFAGTPVDEAESFKLLLDSSDIFRKFYEDVSPQLQDFIIVHDPNLPRGIRARTTRSTGKKYLRLKTLVCPLDDASLIAHELGHFLLDQEGFPAVGGLNDHVAASSLNSAFHDPLVDARLATYGFDRTPDRVQEIHESMRQLKASSRAPTDAAGRAHWISNILGHILAQHVLGVIPVEEEFVQWFKNEYSSIFRKAERIAVEVIEIGFDTPEKMLAALG